MKFVTLNNFFVNIGPSLVKNIEIYPGKESSVFLGKGIVNSIYPNPIMENEIMNIVSSLETGIIVVMITLIWLL